MSKFVQYKRKEDIIFEAVQFTGEPISIIQIQEILHPEKVAVSPDGCIRLCEGNILYPGDYVTRHPNYGIGIFNKDVFEKTYEAIR
jgi:hypothetical protein